MQIISRMMYNVIIFLLLFLITCKSENVGPVYVTIGTGDETGLYYPIGGAIGRIINNNVEKLKIRMYTQSTEGSVYNINHVLSGKLQLGIAQSDRQYQAYLGLKDWKNRGPQTKLRSVLSFHIESVTLVASNNSRIDSVKDLRGKRVNWGNTGSGQLENTKDILRAYHLSKKDMKVYNLKAFDALEKFEKGELDAFFFTVGHPNTNIFRATSGGRAARIISLKGSEIDDLIANSPYYLRTSIPSKYYRNQKTDDGIVSIGVKATLITSSEVDDEIIYSITKEIFENFEEFHKLHPAYMELTKKDLISGLTAPIHSGALKYYKEINLISLIPSQLIVDSIEE